MHFSSNGSLILFYPFKIWNFLHLILSENLSRCYSTVDAIYFAFEFFSKLPFDNLLGDDIQLNKKKEKVSHSEYLS